MWTANFRGDQRWIYSPLDSNQAFPLTLYVKLNGFEGPKTCRIYSGEPHRTLFGGISCSMLTLYRKFSRMPMFNLRRLLSQGMPPWTFSTLFGLKGAPTQTPESEICPQPFSSGLSKIASWGNLQFGRLAADYFPQQELRNLAWSHDWRLKMDWVTIGR